jgi:hypothetical protein
MAALCVLCAIPASRASCATVGDKLAVWLLIVSTAFVIAVHLLPM